MGVRSLLSYIAIQHKDCIESIPMNKMAGCRIAVDGNNFMHYAVAKVEARLRAMNIHKDDEGEILATMCNVLVSCLAPLVRHNIHIVIVMDGTIPDIKINHSMEKNWDLICAKATSSSSECDIRRTNPTEPGNQYDSEEEDSDNGDGWVQISSCKNPKAVRRKSTGGVYSKLLPPDNTSLMRCSCRREEKQNASVRWRRLERDKPGDRHSTGRTIDDGIERDSDSSSDSISTCVVHKPIPMGTYMISYGKRSLRRKANGSRGAQSSYSTLSHRRSDDRFERIGSGKNLMKWDSFDNWNRHEETPSRETFKQRSATDKGGGVGVSHKASLFMDDYVDDDRKDKLRYGGSGKEVAGPGMAPFVSMNGMEKKSFFVDIMLMMGIPVIRALGEAEMTCCAMLASNLVTGIISRDTDHLAIGCSGLIISLQSDKLQKVNTLKLLGEMGISQKEFVDFCILCGTDYNMPSVGYAKCLLGPEKAISIIKNYGTIENAMKYERLPVTKFLECRKTYETPVDLVTFVQSMYTVDMLSSNVSVWRSNRDILNKIGMSKESLTTMDTYFDGQ